MSSTGLNRLRVTAILIFVSLAIAGCSTQATSRYYGKTEAPKENVLRYITGSEPESLDPPIPNGQPEARILMALYDALIEYDPITMKITNQPDANRFLTKNYRPGWEVTA